MGIVQAPGSSPLLDGAIGMTKPGFSNECGDLLEGSLRTDGLLGYRGYSLIPC